MQVRLKEISRITTGTFAKVHNYGEVFYLQARSFDRTTSLMSEIKPGVMWNNRIEGHLLNKGDVLFASKGIENFAFTYKGEVSPAIASSMFLILRSINDQMAIPEYITWFINHPNTIAQLKKIATGSNLPSISKKGLGELKIHLPEIKKQKLIVKISALSKSETQLKREIAKLKELETQQRLFNTIKF